jgi:hypothetical protein
VVAVLFSGGCALLPVAGRKIWTWKQAKKTLTASPCVGAATPKVADVSARYLPRFALACPDQSLRPDILFGVGDLVSVTTFGSMAGGQFAAQGCAAASIDIQRAPLHKVVRASPTDRLLSDPRHRTDTFKVRSRPRGDRILPQACTRQAAIIVRRTTLNLPRRQLNTLVGTRNGQPHKYG